MIYLNNNKIYKLGGTNRAYLNGKLCYQAYVVPEKEISPYWNIVYNDWQDGADGDKLSDHQVYVTNKNNGKIRIAFGGYEEFTIQIRTNHSSTSSYTLIGELNYDWVNSTTTPTYSSAHIVDDTRDTKQTWTPYTFTNLNPKKEYFVDVISISNYDPYWNFLAIPIIPLKKSLSFDLNNQWQASTLALDGYNVYESFSNKGVNNGVSKMRVYISGYDSYTFKIYSDAESNFDYTVVGALDYDWLSSTSTPAYNTANIVANTRGKQKQWIDVSFDGMDTTVEHFFDVIYRKDSSYNSGEDRGYIGLMMNLLKTEWRASEDEFIYEPIGDVVHFYAKEYEWYIFEDGYELKTSNYQKGSELTYSLQSTSAFICNSGNKYNKLEYVVNLSTPVSSGIFVQGDLIEENSSDCQVVEIEWIANTTGSTVSSIQNLTFDSGIQITNQIKFQVKYKWLYSSGGMLVGDTNASDDNDDYRFFNYSTVLTYPSSIYFDINSKRINTNSVSSYQVDGLLEFELGNHYIKNIPTDSIITGTVDTDTFTREGNLALWGGNANQGEGTLSNTDGARIYYWKIYDGDTLVRDFIPALNADKQAGLYDKLNGVFYLPQGTGTLYHSDM